MGDGWRGNWNRRIERCGARGALRRVDCIGDDRSVPETFLILLAGGIMLAAGVSDPKQVTLQWLRLCGIIALSVAGVGMFFLWRRTPPAGSLMWIVHGVLAVVILGQLGFVQVG